VVLEHNRNIREITLPAQPNWTSGLGFRHLMEDGIAILQNQPVGPDRRKYVLDDLSELIGRANRGSDLFRNHALFVASGDRGAVESFSLFDRFLGGQKAITGSLFCRRLKKPLISFATVMPLR
jgi:hypothetical protein